MAYRLDLGGSENFESGNKTSVCIQQLWIPVSALRLLVSQEILYSI